MGRSVCWALVLAIGIGLAGARPAAAATPLTITVIGERSMYYGTSADLATRVTFSDGTPAAGVQISMLIRDVNQFVNSLAGCQAWTDASGVAACVAGDDLLRLRPNGYVLHAFPNQGPYTGSTTVGFAVLGTPTALAYTGPTTFTLGAPALLSAVLRPTTRAFSTEGQLVRFETGTLEEARPGCQGVAGGIGTASCTLAFDRTGAITLSIFYDGQPSTHPYFMPARFDVVVVVVAPLPSTKADCASSGWGAYGRFKSHGDCVSFVATKGRNQPAH